MIRKVCYFGPKKMRFMQTESVLQTKNRSGPAKNRFSVALVYTVCNSVCIFWMHCSKEKPSCSTVMVITANVWVSKILGFLWYACWLHVLLHCSSWPVNPSDSQTYVLSDYRKNPKISDTRKIGSNHPKIWTQWLYYRVMCPKGGDGMANSVDPDQTAPL